MCRHRFAHGNVYRKYHAGISCRYYCYWSAITPKIARSVCVLNKKESWIPWAQLIVTFNCKSSKNMGYLHSKRTVKNRTETKYKQKTFGRSNVNIKNNYSAAIISNQTSQWHKHIQFEYELVFCWPKRTIIFGSFILNNVLNNYVCNYAQNIIYAKNIRCGDDTGCRIQYQSYRLIANQWFKNLV